MSWFLLVVAGLLEIVWALGLKYTHGFTRLTPSLLTIFAMMLSLWFLGLASKTLPIGTAYAVWVGIGVIGSALGGMFFLGESASAVRLLWLGLLALSIVGLKATA
jgi:quaternary ammonium compound-resistance protein SugE